MKISKLIKELKEIQKQEGDIEVTCSATLRSDDNWNVYESTIENLIIKSPDSIFPNKRVRVYL